METTIHSTTRQVVIGPGHPVVMIGERINPTGKKRLAASLAEKDMSRVCRLAISQVADGAGILDVNVGAAGIDEAELLPMAMQAVMETTDTPLCIDTANGRALRAALQVYPGKALINSVNGEEASLERVLPLAKEFGAAVIGLTMDESGIPCDAGRRVEIAKKIVARAEAVGIPREDILIDCLCLAVCTDQNTANVTLDAIRGVREELGVNFSLGASNVSFGLPDRPAINEVFLAMALAAGVNAPIVNPTEARRVVTIGNLLLGHDDFGMNYVTYYREQARGD